MIIKVTQDCIDAANFLQDQFSRPDASYWSKCERCPVAIAMSLAGYVDAVVSRDFLGVRGNLLAGVSIPDKMTDIIYNYDVFKVMKPFQFKYENGRITRVEELS